MKRLIPLTLAAPVVFALPLIMGHDYDSPSCEDYIVTEDRRVPFIAANDIEFIDGMVPHHEGALMMAQMVLMHGSRAEVKALAKTMSEVQAAEIQRLKSIRVELTGSDDVPGFEDPHMALEMREMEGALGEELDRLFLEHMIPHHAGAIHMAHSALANLKRPDLASMAREMIEDQSEEIGTLRTMLGDF